MLDREDYQYSHVPRTIGISRQPRCQRRNIESMGLYLDVTNSRSSSYGYIGVSDQRWQILHFAIRNV